MTRNRFAIAAVFAAIALGSVRAGQEVVKKAYVVVQVEVTNIHAANTSQ